MSNDWKDFIKGIGEDYRKGQETFNKRTSKFLNSDYKILLNPARMGLGKTLATVKVIKDHKGQFIFDKNKLINLVIKKNGER